MLIWFGTGGFKRKKNNINVTSNQH